MRIYPTATANRDTLSYAGTTTRAPTASPEPRTAFGYTSRPDVIVMQPPSPFKVGFTLTCAAEVSGLRRAELQADFFNLLRELSAKALPARRSTHKIKGGSGNVWRCYLGAEGAAGWRALYVQDGNLRTVFSVANHDNTDLRQVRVRHDGDSVSIVLVREGDKVRGEGEGDLSWLTGTGIPEEFAAAIVSAEDKEALIQSLRPDFAAKVRARIGGDSGERTVIIGPDPVASTLAAQFDAWAQRSGLSTTHLVPRETAEHALLDFLSQGSRSILVGPSGVGKTSLLHNLRSTIRSRGLPVVLFRARDLEFTDLAALAGMTGFVLVDGLDELEAVSGRDRVLAVLAALPSASTVTTRFGEHVTLGYERRDLSLFSDLEAAMFWDEGSGLVGSGVRWAAIHRLIGERPHSSVLRDPFFLAALATSEWAGGRPVNDPYVSLLLRRVGGDLTLLATFLRIARRLDRDRSVRPPDREIPAVRLLAGKGLVTEASEGHFEAVHSRLVAAALTLILPLPVRARDVIDLWSQGEPSKHVAREQIRREPGLAVELVQSSKESREVAAKILRSLASQSDNFGETWLAGLNRGDVVREQLAVFARIAPKMPVAERGGWHSAYARSRTAPVDSRLRFAACVEGNVTMLSPHDMAWIDVLVAELACRGFIHGVYIDERVLASTRRGEAALTQLTERMGIKLRRGPPPPGMIGVSLRIFSATSAGSSLPGAFVGCVGSANYNTTTVMAAVAYGTAQDEDTGLRLDPSAPTDLLAFACSTATKRGGSPPQPGSPLLIACPDSWWPEVANWVASNMSACDVWPPRPSANGTTSACLVVRTSVLGTVDWSHPRRLVVLCGHESEDDLAAMLSVVELWASPGVARPSSLEILAPSELRGRSLSAEAHEHDLFHAEQRDEIVKMMADEKELEQLANEFQREQTTELVRRYVREMELDAESYGIEFPENDEYEAIRSEIDDDGYERVSDDAGWESHIRPGREPDFDESLRIIEQEHRQSHSGLVAEDLWRRHATMPGSEARESEPVQRKFAARTVRRRDAKSAVDDLVTKPTKGQTSSGSSVDDQ